MEYHVFNEAYTRLGIIDSYLSSVWNEHYHESGNFTIVAGDNENIARLLKVGHRLWQRGKRTAMIIVFIESDNGVITAHGHTTLCRLEQRIVTPTANIVNAEQGMKAIVNNNMRGLALLATEANTGLTEQHRSQHTWGEVLGTLEDICAATGFGQYMKFDRNNTTKVIRDLYCVYKGRDLTSKVVFREDFGNLEDIKYSDDISVFKNVAYIAGEGEGADRIVEVIGTATGNNRHELYVDARNERQDEDTIANYRQRLRNKGLEKLNEHNRKQSFTAKVDHASFGVESKYYIGDTVKVISKKLGVVLDVRVMAYTEVTENNVCTLNVTFGEPKITIYDEMRLKI